MARWPRQAPSAAKSQRSTTTETHDYTEGRKAVSDEKKIIIDEDWKSQVEAEKAAAEAARKTSDAPTQPAPGAGKPVPKPPAAGQLPPADLSILVTMLATQAMVSLGALPNPLTHKVEADPAQARHFIDLLEMIEEKTKGNTTPEESRLLDGVLHELRMAFVGTK